MIDNAITSTGTNTGALAIGNLNGADKLTTVIVAGDGDIEVVINADDDANVATLSAATMTGGLTIDLSGSGKAITANTGSGDDVLTFGAQNDTINAGDGDNTVVTGNGTNSVPRTYLSSPR